nr:immunoglobulin light chain junction region [Macaca mulatta]
CQKYLNSPFIF